MFILRIQLLGDFRLHNGTDEAIAINQARQQALLAYLLLHRHAPQSRQHLAFLLWPDSSETQALTNLRKALTHLRQADPLLVQAIFADYKVIQWRPTFPCLFDVLDFEEKLAQATSAQQAGRHSEAIALLAAAVALYSGPLLPSCYDDWLIAERERLHQLCLNALAQLIVVHEHQRNWALAIYYAQQLLRLDPSQEMTYLQLMRLQALQSDRAAALRTYHTCATMLERELGVEPGNEMQAAYARLLKLEPPATMRATATSRAQGISITSLVGRQAEWRQLQAAWRLAIQDRAHFVCVLGEAGIGKTHLAEALLTWASQQGFVVARTRSYIGEGQLAYAPVVEWLRAEPMRAARQRLAQVWVREVARLVPEILAEQPTIAAPAPITERWQRQQLWEALARVLLAAPQPLLLLIDDLQWCDQETLAWIHYLLHFDPRARVLVLGTARAEEIDTAHPLATLLRHLGSADQLTEIHLGPLDAEQTSMLATQIAQQALSPAAQQALYRATAGNPLFVVETVRAGVADQIAVPSRLSLDPSISAIPPKVQAVIQSRLAQLSPMARSLAHLAAVIGRAFTFDLLVQASGESEDEVVRALDELWQRRIILEQGTHTYDFSHDRIRDGAYAAVSPIRRRHLHRQSAGALEKLYAAELDTMSAALAYHYEQAGLFNQALVYYQQAAAVAQAIYAYREAALYVQHGLTLLKSLPTTRETPIQEMELLITQGELLCATLGFATPEVGAIYDKALALCRQVGNQVQCYTIQNKLVFYHLNRGDFKQTHHFAEDNFTVASALQDQEKIQDSYVWIGFAHLNTGMVTAALRRFVQALAIPVHHQVRINQIEVDANRNALVLSAICLWLLGYPDQAHQRAQQTLRLLQSTLDPVSAASVLEFILIVHQMLHNKQAMQTQAENMIAVAAKYDIPMYHTLGMIYREIARAHQGITPKIDELKQGLDRVKQTGVLLYTPYCLALLVEVCALTRQNVEALKLLVQLGVDTTAVNQARYSCTSW